MLNKLGILTALAGIVALAASAFAPAATYAADPPPPPVPSVILHGAGVLDAQGDGLAAVRGAMDLHVSASEGILLVRDLDNDAYVHVEGNGQTAHRNGFTVYFGFHGDARVIARDAGVIVIGKDIDLHVAGKGWAFLKGHGSFTANGHGPFEWNEQGVFGSVTP
jgi:hypothetical protein